MEPTFVGHDHPSDQRVPGLLLLLIGGAFLTVTMLAASIAPGYDFHDGKISDLGVITETALLFNVLVAAIGVLNGLAGYLLWRSHRRGWLLGIYVISAIGAVGVGLFPLDTGTPHSGFALVAFVFFNLEAIGTGAALRSAPTRVLSIGAGLLGLAYVVVMLVGDGGNTDLFGAIGHGGSERLIVYPVMLWLLAFGGRLTGHSVARLAVPSETPVPRASGVPA